MKYQNEEQRLETTFFDLNVACNLKTTGNY